MTNETKTCNHCGKYFTKTDNRGRRIYCSNKCADAVNRANRGPEYWRQRHLKLKAAGWIQPRNKIEMPKVKLTDDYDWDMIDSLTAGSTKYG